MEERYEKLKKFAEKFIICQFGMPFYRTTSYNTQLCDDMVRDVFPGLSTFTRDTQDNHKCVVWSASQPDQYGGIPI